jgi:hypothetical protein
MGVLSTDISATGVLSAFTGDRFFLATGFWVLIPVRWTLDFVLFGCARFAAALRAGLALVLPRFELFLRTAAVFFTFGMAVSCTAPIPLDTGGYLIST